MLRTQKGAIILTTTHVCLQEYIGLHGVSLCFQFKAHLKAHTLNEGGASVRRIA